MTAASPNYAAVVWPDRRRALGRELLPTRIGHALLLWRLGNGLATGRPAGLGDVLGALHVLTRPAMEAAAGWRDGRARWWLRVWGWQAGWLGREAAWREAAAEMEAHLAEAWRGPRLWDRGGEGRAPGAPALALLKTRLMGCLGMGEVEAMETPIQRALWDLAAWGEDRGLAEWVSEEEMAEMAALERMLAELPPEGLGPGKEGAG